MSDFLTTNKKSTLVRGRPRREDQSRNGVKVIVHRDESGSTVQADCQCFGGEMRLHTKTDCPLRLRQLRDSPQGKLASFMGW